MKLFPAALGAACLIAAALYAEINPQYYREMQADAPEQLRIKTISVKRDWYFWSSTRTVNAEAEVVAVKKSAAGLTRGSRIFFSYEIFTPPDNGWSGPRPMPLLEAGKEYDLFAERTGITKDKGVILQPVARGYSFETLP